MQLPIQIDAGAIDNLQVQISGQIRQRILDGRLPPGTRMPATRALACDLAVSRNTVVAAFQRLIAEGLLEAREPIGTYVARTVVADGPKDVATTADDTPAQQAPALPAQRMRLQFHGQPHHVVNPYKQAVPLDFWVGRPDARLFPYRIWQSLLTRMLHDAERKLCEYGDPQGLPALRQAVAAHVGASRGIATDASRIVITNGIQEGLSLIGQLLVGPGIDVAIECPCYSGASRVFASWGAALHPVAVDAQGIVTDKLPQHADLVYVTPSHQYPLGPTLALQRREALLAWSEACDGFIVEDDYDADFFYDASPLPALKSLDRGDRVIYLGTFSKSLGAGLRLGYMILPAELCQAAVSAKALLNNCQPWLEQAALAAFIAKGGYANHLRRLRHVYAGRRDHLRAALAHCLSEWRVDGAASGMHLVVHLPRGGPGAQAIEQAARAHSVGVYGAAHGNVDLFHPAADDPVHHMLMFGYAALNESEISDALLRLRQAVGGSLAPAWRKCRGELRVVD